MPSANMTRAAHRATLEARQVLARQQKGQSSRSLFVPSVFSPVTQRQRFATIDRSYDPSSAKPGSTPGHPTPSPRKHPLTNEPMMVDLDSAFDLPSTGEEALRPTYDSASKDIMYGNENMMMYLTAGALGLGGLYMIFKENPSASLEPGRDARGTHTKPHDLPAHKPLNSKTEKMIGREPE